MLKWFRRRGTAAEHVTFHVEIKEVRLDKVVLLSQGDGLVVQFKRGDISADDKSVFSPEISLDKDNAFIAANQPADRQIKLSMHATLYRDPPGSDPPTYQVKIAQIALLHRKHEFKSSSSGSGGVETTTTSGRFNMENYVKVGYSSPLELHVVADGDTYEIDLPITGYYREIGSASKVIAQIYATPFNSNEKEQHTIPGRLSRVNSTESDDGKGKNSGTPYSKYSDNKNKSSSPNSSSKTPELNKADSDTLSPDEEVEEKGSAPEEVEGVEDTDKIDLDEDDDEGEIKGNIEVDLSPEQDLLMHSRDGDDNDDNNRASSNSNSDSISTGTKDYGDGDLANTKDLDSTNADLVDAKGKIQKLNKMLSEAAALINQQRVKLEKASEYGNRQTDQLKAANEEIQRLKADKVDSKTDVGSSEEELREELKEAHEHIEKYQEKLVKAAAYVKNQQEKLDEAHEEIERLNSCVVGLDSKNTDGEITTPPVPPPPPPSLAPVSEELEEANAMIAAYAEKLQQAAIYVHSKNEELAAAQHEIERLKLGFIDLGSEEKEEQPSSSSAEDLAEANATIAAYSEKLQQAANYVRNQLEQISAAHEEIERLKEEVSGKTLSTAGKSTSDERNIDSLQLEVLELKESNAKLQLSLQESKIHNVMLLQKIYDLSELTTRLEVRIAIWSKNSDVALLPSQSPIKPLGKSTNNISKSPAQSKVAPSTSTTATATITSQTPTVSSSSSATTTPKTTPKADSKTINKPIASAVDDVDLS